MGFDFGKAPSKSQCIAIGRLLAAFAWSLAWAPPATAVGEFVIREPNSRMTWLSNQTVHIYWTSPGTSASPVTLRLERGGSVIATISASTANDGYFMWKIPAGLTEAGNYQVRITAVGNSGVYTLSQAFAIAQSWPSFPRGPNLVFNPTFEQSSTKPNRPLGWSQLMVPDGYPGAGNQMPVFIQRYLPTGGVGDSACIEVGNSFGRYTERLHGEENTARYRLESAHAFPIDAYKFYRFSVWYKTSNEFWSQARAQVDTNASGTSIRSNVYYIPASSEWKQYVAYFRPVRPTDRGFGQVEANSCRIVLGMGNSRGTVRFDNVSVTEVSPSEYHANLPLHTFQPPPLAQRRAATPNFSPAPNYTVRKDAKGAWWFVRPDGRPFWWRAVQYPHINAPVNPELFYSLPNAFRTASSSNHEHGMDAMVRLGNLGFSAEMIEDDVNGPALHKFGQAHFITLTANYPIEYLLRDKDDNYDTDRKPMPDPFNPAFRAWLRAQYRSVLDALPAPGLNDPEIAGFFTDNEMAIEYLDRFIWSTHCAHAFVDFVRARYGNNIQSLNAAWSDPIYHTFNLGGFNEILSASNKYWIGRYHFDGALNKDLRDFIVVLLKEHYKLVCSIVREYEVEKFGDSNGDGIANRKRLIATNRYDLAGFPNNMLDDLFLAMEAVRQLRVERPGYYFDVIAANNYPGDAFRYGAYQDNNLAMLEQMSINAGLPVMITEFGVGGRDSGILTGSDYNNGKDVGWFRRSVDTQSDRAMVFDKHMRLWAGSPYMVGAQWFSWANTLQQPWGSLTTPVNTDTSYYVGRNNGVVDNNNQFYQPFAGQMAATNQAIESAQAWKAAADLWPDTAFLHE